MPAPRGQRGQRPDGPNEAGQSFRQKTRHGGRSDWNLAPSAYRIAHLTAKLSGSIRFTDMRYLISLLALAGVIVSSLALRVHYDTGTEPCSINEKWDCGIVNHSPFAEIAHVPVAAIGIVGYLAIAIMSFMRRRAWLLVSALVGMGFALYLTNIERTVLEVWCLYCVISQGIIAATTLLSLGWLAAHAWAKRRARSMG